MVFKKKKTNDDDYIEEEEDHDEELDEFDLTDDDLAEDNNFNGMDPTNDLVTNPLELASKTLSESEVFQQFPEAFKEASIAFYDHTAKNEYIHQGAVFRNYGYIRKVLTLQKAEDDNIINNRKKLYTIKTVEELKAYLKSLNKYYLFRIIEDSNLLYQVIEEIQTLKPSGIEDDFQNISKSLNDIYSSYNKEVDIKGYVDDGGALGKMVSITAASRGEGGNERLALTQTVQASRNIDMIKETEDKIPVISSMKRVARRFM